MVNNTRTIDDVFAALGDPARRTIVERLARGESTVGDLARPLPMTLPAVLKHLDVLQQAGVVVTRKQGRVRYCRLDPRALDRASTWIERRRRVWENRMNRLGTYLEGDV